MKIVWTRSALLDRRSIYLFVEREDQAAAIRLDELFDRAAQRLSALPHLGRIGRRSGTREMVVHPRYLLIYDITQDHIRVLRMLHTARKWPPEPK